MTLQTGLPGEDLVLMHPGATVVERGELAVGWRYLIWARQKGSEAAGIPRLLVSETTAFSSEQVFGYQLERVAGGGPEGGRDDGELFDRVGFDSLWEAKGAMESRYIRSTGSGPLEILLALVRHWVALRLGQVSRGLYSMKEHPGAVVVGILFIVLLLWLGFAWVFPLYLQSYGLK